MFLKPVFITGISIILMMPIAMSFGERDRHLTPMPDVSINKQPYDASTSAECQLSKGGSPETYFTDFVAGDALVTYYDPETCGGGLIYPFEITSFSFNLYDWNYDPVQWPVTVDVVVFSPAPPGDSCGGPGTELCRVTAVCDEVTFGFPAVGTVTFPTPCCTQGPFFMGIEYIDMGDGPFPSLVFDNTDPVPYCDNWAYRDGWLEWHDFWDPPEYAGYPVSFSVHGETVSENCGASENIVWSDVLSGGHNDTIWAGEPVTIGIGIFNSSDLSGIDLGFEISSPEGAQWNWDNVGGYGLSGAVTVTEGSRMDPPETVWDMTGLVVSEQSMDGLSPDSISMGGVSMIGGLPAGDPEYMMNLHLTIDSIYGDGGYTLCIDKMDNFVFAGDPGGTIYPDWTGPRCFHVILPQSDSICCPIEPTPGCEAEPCTSFVPVEKWKWESSEVHPFYDQVHMTPIVADLENDGHPEIFFTAFKGTYFQPGLIRVIRVIENNEVVEVLTWPPNDPWTNGGPVAAAQLAVADIDGDGWMDIVAAWQPEPNGPADPADPDGLVILDVGPGYVVTPQFIPFPISDNYSPPSQAIFWGFSIADVNQDGTAEIIAGNYVIDALSGYFHPGWPPAAADNGAEPLIGGPISFAADIDPSLSSPGLEIVNGRTVYKEDGTVLWSLTPAIAGDNALGGGHAGVADLDLDGLAEVVVVWDGNVSVVDYIPGMAVDYINNPVVKTIQVVYTQPASDRRGGPPCIGEFITSLPGPEIGVAFGGKYVVLDVDNNNNLTDVRSWPTADVSSGSTGSTVFDFEGDGIYEIVYNDEHTLWIFDAENDVVKMQIANNSFTAYENPVVADVDNDGRAEIVVCANNYLAPSSPTGIRVFKDLNDCWVNTRRIWNQHAYSITNVMDDGKIPQFRETNWGAAGFNNFRAQQFWHEDPFKLPDLCVHMVTSECDPFTGNMTITIAIANNGAIAAGFGVPITLYRCNGPDCMRIEMLGGLSMINDILPGELGYVSFTMVDCYDEKIWVDVCVDHDFYGKGHLPECDETNNCCCVHLNDACCQMLVGSKFEDVNMNGQCDPFIDNFLSGWPMKLFNDIGGGMFVEVDNTTTTSNGQFYFRDVRPGTYRIIEDHPAGWIQTTPKTPYCDVIVEIGGIPNKCGFGNKQISSVDCIGIDMGTTVTICEAYNSVRGSFVVAPNGNMWSESCNEFRWWLVAYPAGQPTPSCTSGDLILDPHTGTVTFPLVNNPSAPFGEVLYTVDRSKTNPSLEIGGYACYQIYILNECTNEIYCIPGRATVANPWWCPAWVTYPPFPIARGYDSTLYVKVLNNGSPDPFHYKFEALFPDEMTPDPYVTLNGLPPGTAVEDSVDIAIGDSAIIAVSTAFTEARQHEVHQVVMHFDVDGDGDMEPGLTTSLIWNCTDLPGDANDDGNVNVGDAVYLINYVFKAGPPPTPYPICSGDANCDCDCNVGDAVYVITYVFKGGPSPCDCVTWLSNCGPPLRK